MKNYKLYNYQRDSITFIKEKKKCALFLEMGLGKTLISLNAIDYFLKNEKFKKILIVAPLKVANTVWAEEIKKWNIFKNIKYNICTGNIKNRIKAIESDFNVLIINSENLCWLLNISNISWDMLIIDESSTFKNYKSKRFKCLIRKKINFSSVVLLSGTPCPNNYLDLWSQIYLLDNGKRLGKNITTYKNNFFLKQDFMGYTWKLKIGAKQHIQNLISDITLTMKIKDHVKLPNKIYINYYKNFPKEVVYIYKKMQKDFFININKKNITSVSAAVCANKLLQICNGCIYDNNKNIVFLHNKKIDMLAEILEKYKEKNFLIAYNFKSDLFLIKKHFPQSVELSPSGKEISLWNKNKIKILLAHPLSSCYGLNAYEGGHIVIWYGLSWSLQNYLQFNSRLYRLGQKNDVIIINILIKGGLDEKIIKCLNFKNYNQNEFMEKLKKIGEHNVK